MSVTPIDPQSETFHLEVKALRAERNLSQERLARAINVDKRTITLWETPVTGKNFSRPRGETLDRLRAFIGEDLNVMPAKLTLTLAKQLLSRSLGVPVEAIEITVKY